MAHDCSDHAMDGLGASACAVLEAASKLIDGSDSAKRRAQISRAQRNFARLFRAQGALVMKRMPLLADRFLAPKESMQEALDDDLAVVFGEVFAITRADAEDYMAQAMLEGVGTGYLETASDFGLDKSFKLQNERATEWARVNAASEVTKIDAATMAEMRGVVERGIDAGTSYGAVARDIRDRFDGFTTKRAETVAVFENRMAYESGGLSLAADVQDAGVEMEKSWLGTEGDPGFEDCPICKPNSEGGWLPLDQAYQSGHQHPPGHPSCKCGGLHRMKRQREAERNLID